MPPRAYPARIVRVVRASPIDRSFEIEVDAPTETFAFVPGQFVVIHDPMEDSPRRRAYSISSAPHEHEQACFTLTVRDMGSFGRAFYRFRVGKALRVEAPMGRFVLDAAETKPLVLLAGGAGVTPFRSFVVHLHRVGPSRPVALLSSARTVDQLLYRARFESLARHPWFTYRPHVTRGEPDDGWEGARGRIQADSFIDLPFESPSADWYACGPPAFVKAMLGVADTQGVRPSAVKREQWG